MQIDPQGLVAALAVLQGVLFFVLIFVGAATDAAQGKVHNMPCAIGLVAGLLLSFARGGLHGGPVSLVSSAAACGVGFVIFLLFYLIGGLGAGDVKLMAAVGALAASWKFMLWVIANTAFAGIPLALGLLIWRGDLKDGLKRSVKSLFKWKYERPANAAAGGQDQNVESATSTSAPHVPYAVAICIGALWTVWMFMERHHPLPFL